MTKADLVRTLAQAGGVDMRTAQTQLELLVLAVQEELRTSNTINIDRLGTFYLHTRPAYNTRNPKTGEPVRTKPLLRIRFRPSKMLYEGVTRA